MPEQPAPYGKGGSHEGEYRVVYSPPEYQGDTALAVRAAPYYERLGDAYAFRGWLWTDDAAAIGFAYAEGRDVNQAMQFWVDTLRTAKAAGTSARDLFDYWTTEANSVAFHLGDVEQFRSLDDVYAAAGRSRR